MSSIISSFSWHKRRIEIPEYQTRNWIPFMNEYNQMEMAGQGSYPVAKESIGNISYRRRMELQSAELKKRAADIDIVIEMFNKNPDLEKMLDAMRRLGV